MLLAAAAGACSGWLEPATRRWALQGLGSAWAASTAGACALIVARPVSMKAFWWAFGGGMALRGLVFAAWMWRLWDAPSERQGAVLAAYALGVLGFLLLEYKNL